MPNPRPFIPRNDAQLWAFDDERLVRYIADAKRVGRIEDAKRATHLLLHRHETRMLRRLQAQLPAFLAHHADTIAEWVFERVWKSALKLPLKGESVGEWVNWWKTAVARQVISFWRSPQGKALEKEIQWPDQRVGDDGEASGVDSIGEDFDVEALAYSLDIRAAIETALASTNAKHQAIVEAAFFEDRASKDVGSEFDETPANVDQIKKRFKEALRAELVRRGVWAS